MSSAADAALRRLESLLYGRRGQPLSILLLVLFSILLGWQALSLRPDAGFDKNVPREHPMMQVLRHYHADFGGANNLLVALVQDQGDIYNADFMRALETASTELSFIRGIDRNRVASLFTRNVSFVEVDEQGFAGDNVIPPDYQPSAEMFELIRLNVGKAGLIGHLVSLDQRGAMISAEVLERDPVSGRGTDLVAVSQALESQIRQRLTRPQRHEIRTATDLPGIPAGELLAVRYDKPAPWLRWTGLAVPRPGSEDASSTLRIPGRDLRIEAVANPDYMPGLSVHILGFTSIVGAVAAASGEVALYFALTVLLCMLALRLYLGSLRLALLPLACSLIAVVWEFGLLRLAGFGLDPFAILVPFLVLAVSTSHGVQYVNRWADQITDGASPVQASKASFRRLFVPGSIAILTNIAGFMTMILIPIGAVREMAIHASLGMLAVLVANKLIMPIWLARLRVPDVERFRRHRARTEAALEPLWRTLSLVTRTPQALALIVLSLVVLLGSAWLQQDRIIGDAQIGVPELRPDSTYNRDVRAIQAHFALGTDVLKVIAETEANACIDHQALDQIDTFSWRMRNVPGVTATQAMTDVARQIYAAMNEGNPNFLVLPRNRYSLVLITTPIESSTGLLDYHCTAMPVLVFASDHTAETIERLRAAAERFNADNAEQFFSTARPTTPELCADKTARRRELGDLRLQRQELIRNLARQGIAEHGANAHPDVLAVDRRLAGLEQELAALPSPCPVHFALGTGNLAVMAATNEAVAKAEWPALAWVYGVIFVLLLVSYRSLRAWLVIGIPLFMVSVFANALMAVLGIGLKVATLPVVTLAVGIGVDYGIYIYDVLHRRYREGGDLQLAYLQTLRETGKAVIFTGLVLAGSVASWLASDLQFQRDMGLLLIFMFSANMLGAVLLCPAYARFLLTRSPRG